MRTDIRLGTPEWHEARKRLVTSTDMTAILGLSPYQSEGDVARRKMGEPERERDAASQRRLRLGTALEDLIRAEDEIEHGIKIRRLNYLFIHDQHPWAGTSCDFERVGEKCIVEAKSSRDARWDDGLPPDVEVQVRWQMGIAQYPMAHVVVLRYGSQLECHDVWHDQPTFDGMLRIAADFRRRLEVGGPFAETLASINRAHPADNGAEMLADEVLDSAGLAYLDSKERLAALEKVLDDATLVIKERMGPFAVLRGRGWRATWKRGKERKVIEHDKVEEALSQMVEADRLAEIIEANTHMEPGRRPLLVRREKE